MASSRKKSTVKSRAKTGRTAPKAARKPDKPNTPNKKVAPKQTPKASVTGLSLKSAGPSFTVDNLQKSLAWYRDVLGFTVGERWEEKGTLLGVSLKAGSVEFMISQDDWGKGRHRIKGAGFRIFCETDQDIDALASGIKSRGGTLADEPRDDMGMRAFAVQDPDGFKITIMKSL